VISLCDRFHKLPSEIEAEDVKLLRYLEIIRVATPEGGVEE
jgi:hypothetical protein